MAQYLVDQPAPPAETVSAPSLPPQSSAPSAAFDPEKTMIIPPRESASMPAPEFALHEQLSPTIPVSDQLVSHRFAGEPTPPPVASAEGLEFTAVPPVPDIPIAQESGLETTLQSGEAPTIILKDHALVTDPQRATMDFPTQFGTSETPVIDLPVTAEVSPAPSDEFEARLQAALASYEQPSTDLPLPTPADAPIDLHAALNAELPAPAEPQAAQGTELPSPLGTAAFEEDDEPFFATAPIGSTDLALPEPGTPEVPQDFVQSNVVEFPSPASAPPAPVQLPQYDSIAEEAAPEIVLDGPLVAASADLDLSAAQNTEVMPMAMAAAAAAVPPIASPHPNFEAETELARALKTTLLSEADSGATSFAAPEVQSSAPDANRLAAAVEKVMHRELPALIWKIMAELDIGKR
jgi:hypothetical protein